MTSTQPARGVASAAARDEDAAAGRRSSEASPEPGGGPGEAQPPDDCRRAGVKGSPRGAWIGAAWIGFWLILLVPVFLSSLRRGDDAGRAAAAALVLGAAAYSVACWIGFNPYRPTRHSPVGLACVGIGALAAAATTALIGDAGLVLVPYVAVSIVCSLPLVLGVPITLAGIALTLVLARGFSWGPDGQDGMAGGVLIGAVVATLGTSMGRWSIQRDVAAAQYRRQAFELGIQDERNRMARDLHDILGHSLTVISLKADLAGKLIERDPPGAARELQEVARLARSALADVRATVNGYREISLTGELVRARQALTDAGVRAELPSAVDDVDPELRELFAWVVREAVTNVVRHAGARTCTVTLQRDRITVSDDGRGRVGTSDGNGLEGLRERARRAGALVETGPREVSHGARPGFVVTVREDA